MNPLKQAVERVAPGVYYTLRYLQEYRRVVKTMGGNRLGDRQRLFAEMVARSIGRPAMQIGVRGAKYAPHWTSVDLFDQSPLIDYHYDIHDLKFEAETFEFVACLAILEHVEDPHKAISELYRVLKPGGEVWVEVPFNYPYHLAPIDLWRVSPDGLRRWMISFAEIDCGVFCIDHTSILTGVFFHGRKP
jgi:SAM-dependent methyltransferase